MEKLYKKIKHINLEDAIKIEKSDSQFKSLKDLHKNIENKKLYLAFIISNSIICYQLSSKWEDYWKEFSLEWTKYKLEKTWDIIDFFKYFLTKSKWNRRFTTTKINRLKKLDSFFKKFIWKEKYFYENMLELRDLLAKTMNQDKQAKTIVFAVKMFCYWARNYFWKLIKFPKEISIPIDSRLINLFEKYKEPHTDINKFYSELSEKTWLAPLHLDAVIWVNYKDLI